MKTIPVHKLNDQANLGIVLKHSSALLVNRNISYAHRDDHYIFFLVEEGNVTMMVDFEQVVIPQYCLYYILPGQVHYGIGSLETAGWFIAADTAHIAKEFRLVFENQLLLQKPYALNAQQYQQCHTLVKLLNQHYELEEQGPFYTQVLYSLLNTFVGMAACGYSTDYIGLPSASRPVQIAHAFKKLLSENIICLKSPSAYAERLHISEPYLNEILKKATGFSATYWIINEVMLEAKRFLYHSDLNVKEIAHQLGYEDHTYFSRLFKKSTGSTPLAFRELYHE